MKPLHLAEQARQAFTDLDPEQIQRWRLLDLDFQSAWAGHRTGDGGEGRPGRRHGRGAPRRSCALGGGQARQAVNPSDHHDLVLGRIPLCDTRALRAVRSWQQTSQRYLVLHGANGPGKSGAGSLPIWEHEPAPGQAQPYFLTIEEAYRFQPYGVADIHLFKAPLLLWDEAGRVYADRNEYAQTKLQALMLARHNSRQRTIVTTNRELSTLAEYLGPAVWDRVEPAALIVRCTDPSLRSGR